MSDEHEHLAGLVVGHVLGDLPGGDAARFRTHLQGCADCRSRVAELRGIAADLADAERDELARARVATQAPRRVRRSDDADPSTGRITIRHVTAAVVGVLLLAGAMGFWNLHLRTTSAIYFGVAQERGEALEALATGEPLIVTPQAGVSGVAAVDGDEVAVSLAGVERPERGELVVAWFLDGPDGDVPVAVAGPGRLADGVFVFTATNPGATQLVITRERDPGDSPEGLRIASVVLPAGDVATN